MKIKLFVAREIQYFELGILSFNLYVRYLIRGFNLPTRYFSHPTLLILQLVLSVFLLVDFNS